ncbi:hypothetical protein CHL67_03535 [Prosthecochloris sp. GSB1]|uniref:AfsA-related hotdog domain-containing protein n=1 Tax=Prosthecochloris sp. GSB1 TaxID=281093 RepID=UPI000B8CFE92|nr:AfsA-related hotdog domain-containing protein [Prosthecochloris sp. GSB1]ASQ90122.1 hypothetical protein CHL67_03535 [Prosthecochloris sp. GSB1]
MSKESCNRIFSRIPVGASYVLYFDGDELPVGINGLVKVRVPSFDVLRRYLGILGDSAAIYVSENYHAGNPHIAERLDSLDFVRDRDAVLREVRPEDFHGLVNVLPLNVGALAQTHLALQEKDQEPPSIEQHFVHKLKPQNVLVSRPLFSGGFLYFNMYHQSGEIVFDHNSDHVQGMLVLEAMRQAAIATTHLSGNLPIGGTIALLSYNFNFYNFMEKGTPIIIRCYTPVSLENQVRNAEVFVCCQVFQWGKMSASSFLRGTAFPDRSKYSDYRRRTKKVHERDKKQYEMKMSEILDPVKA